MFVNRVKKFHLELQEIINPWDITITQAQDQINVLEELKTEIEKYLKELQQHQNSLVETT